MDEKFPPKTMIMVGNFFQKLVLKWSEMPKKHDSLNLIFGEEFLSPTQNDDHGGKFSFFKVVLR